ncbi:MAG: prepilin-type N-terminal cleavage/methylation domain-containing protein [Akkermansiaceae bacterium]|nr:prepilin-type N-terminal cleavage/methylation domain-containing protein [Akkermansiaceae bacterium]
MTSAARTNKRRSGFTLLEIVIVLSIAAVVIGGAVGLMVYSSDERVLRNASGEIEVLAKRARTTAMLLQTPYALEFRERVVRLLPLAEAGQDEKRTVGGRRIGGEKVVTDDAERWEYPLEDGVEVSIRRWNTTDWLPTRKDTVHVWRFDPNGLCEPLSVKLTLGKSWSEDIFNPLTAAVRENFMEAR